jgi:hypothetical protein
VDRPLRIALLARRLTVLAQRPELLTADPDTCVAQALTDSAPGPLELLDAVLATSAGELDRMCAHAVRWLGSTSAGKRAVLDVLGVLTPDRIVAMYYALPPERRKVARRDPAWAFHVQQVEAEMPAALEWVEEAHDREVEFVASTPEEAHFQDRLHAARRDSLRKFVSPADD